MLITAHLLCFICFFFFFFFFFFFVCVFVALFYTAQLRVCSVQVQGARQGMEASRSR